jgi:hypothetical protein
MGDMKHYVTEAWDDTKPTELTRINDFVVKTTKPYQLGQLGEFFEVTQCQK